jgi:GT2 family glycosyltransferase
MENTPLPDFSLSPEPPARFVLVSVIIPAYQCADSIAQALHSVFQQTLRDYEIIVVDDGSPDREILEQELRPLADRIRLIQQENQGPSGARNTGIRAACGKYVAFLDSDDLWFPEHLATQIEMLENNPSLALAYADALLTVNRTPVRTYFEACPQSHPVTFQALVTEQCSVVTSCTVARREAVIQAGMFDREFRRCEDFDLWTRIVHSGYGADYSRKVQAVHHTRNGLSGDAEAMKRSLVAVYKKMAARPDISEEDRNCILKQLARAEAELALELCRKSLLAGDGERALSEAMAARRVIDTSRMRRLVVALRIAPRLTSWAYRLLVKLRESGRRNRVEKLPPRLWPEELAKANPLASPNPAEVASRQ